MVCMCALPAMHGPGVCARCSRMQYPPAWLTEQYGSGMGWTCPKCGRVNAPHVAECPCSPVVTYTHDSYTTTDGKPIQGSGG
jgi:hypothetical protein